MALGLAGGRAARLIAERQAAVEPTEGLRDPIYTLRELGWPSTHFPAGTQVAIVFASFCGECVGSVPAWNELAAAGVQLHAVTATLQEDARVFVRRHDVRFPVIAYPGDRDLAPLGLETWTVLLDAEGMLAGAWRGLFGQVEQAELLADLDDLEP